MQFFSRISERLQELSVYNEETSDHTDIELIQHINVDIERLTKLFAEQLPNSEHLRKSTVSSHAKFGKSSVELDGYVSS